MTDLQTEIELVHTHFRHKKDYYERALDALKDQEECAIFTVLAKHIITKEFDAKWLVDESTKKYGPRLVAIFVDTSDNTRYVVEKGIGNYRVSKMSYETRIVREYENDYKDDVHV